jgi:hypothetical protein
LLLRWVYELLLLPRVAAWLLLLLLLPLCWLRPQQLLLLLRVLCFQGALHCHLLLLLLLLAPLLVLLGRELLLGPVVGRGRGLVWCHP